MINLTAITWVRFLDLDGDRGGGVFRLRQAALVVGPQEGDGLALSQEELKATWKAEQDSGWVPGGDEQPAGSGRAAGTAARGNAARDRRGLVAAN